MRYREFRRIAKYLNLTLAQFKERYIIRGFGEDDDPFSFKLSTPCAFWINNKCAIHPVKPKTCADFDPSRVPARYAHKWPGKKYTCEQIQYHFWLNRLHWNKEVIGQ